MKFARGRSKRQVTAAALAISGLALGSLAHAENHALIMWIGDYGDSRNNLPGIDLDAANARKIAAGMGVPSRNMVELSNAELTKSAVANALVGMNTRIKDGDKVFIYYSGHGSQREGVDGAKCTESIVTRGPDFFYDYELQASLTRLGAKASQVIMMNDSCFSGGAATKSLTKSPEGLVPKFYPGEKVNSSIGANYTCGEAVNKMARTLEVVGAAPRGPQVLYIAAAADNEVSYASRNGSVATVAWAACLTGGRADSNHSGAINGEELQQCSQQWINQHGGRQTVTLQGNAQLPVSFAGAAGGGSDAAPVNAAQALYDLQASGDKSYQVQLVPANSSMRIGQDFLDFSVSTNREGYLYILQVGSDGKTFNLLFPNKIDSNNFVSGGVQRFPRETWRVRAGGPAGTSHLLAIISPVKKDLSKSMDLSSTFASTGATEGATKTLMVETSGASAGGSGRYGASEVVKINER